MEIKIKEWINEDEVTEEILYNALFPLSEVRITRMFPKTIEIPTTCERRWKEQGYGVLCGHQLPCPVHSLRATIFLDVIKKILESHKATTENLVDEKDKQSIRYGNIVIDSILKEISQRR